MKYKNKLEYAYKMLSFHSRMLIKWSKFIEKNNKIANNVKTEQIIKGQLSIYDLVEKEKQ